MFSVARLRENRKMQPRAARIIFRLSGGGGRVKLWMVRILAKQFRPCFFSENILRKFCAGGFFKMLRACSPPPPNSGRDSRGNSRADRGIDFYSSAHFSRPPFARSQRQAAGAMRHSAGCALLRRQRCTCAARGMRDRLRGRAGAVHSPSVIGGGRRGKGSGQFVKCIPRRRCTRRPSLAGERGGANPSNSGGF